jgi:uncharacterized protein with PIN domain
MRRRAAPLVSIRSWRSGMSERPPARAWFRFYAELNDHLPPDQRFQTIEKQFFVPGSVKDRIESFGVPHTEVELILINGQTVDFAALVHDGDRVSVYPVFESFDVQSEIRVRPRPLRDLGFLLDVHLGKLAAYLRMLGFDAEYRNSAGDPELVRSAAARERILLTRDRGLLKHSAVTRGYWVRQTESRRQVAEIIERFDLAGSMRPFTRCMACNAVLQPVDRSEVLHRVPPRTAERHQRFLQCPGCGRVYWPGSHYRRMQQWIDNLLQFDL